MTCACALCVMQAQQGGDVVRLPAAHGPVVAVLLADLVRRSLKPVANRLNKLSIRHSGQNTWTPSLLLMGL